MINSTRNIATNPNENDMILRALAKLGDGANRTQNELTVLKDQLVSLNRENVNLRLKLTECSKDAEAFKVLLSNMKFGALDLADYNMGMDIDSKILLPIKATDLDEDLMAMLNLILFEFSNISIVIFTDGFSVCINLNRSP